MTTRITGGSHRGRRLRTATRVGLRPTSERVRAALFSIIGSEAVDGKRVADLYAGTGSIGLDALSRGAAWVDFVESNRRLCRELTERLRSWSLETRARVYRGRVLSLLRSLPGGYDLVVADPPYSSNELADVVDKLQSARLVNPGGLVVLEHRSGSNVISALAERATESETGRFELETTKRYGDTELTVLSLRKRATGAADG